VVSRAENPVSRILFEQLLHRINRLTKVLFLTFGSKIEYTSSVSSLGEIFVPQQGHKKSPFPSISIKLIVCTNTCFTFNHLPYSTLMPSIIDKKGFLSRKFDQNYRLVSQEKLTKQKSNFG